MSIGLIGRRQHYKNKLKKDLYYGVYDAPKDGTRDEGSYGNGENWDIDILIDQIKKDAINFLHFHEIPYVDTLLGDIGIPPSDFIEKYNHIQGVRPALGILFESHCFSVTRHSKKQYAYVHLLRASAYSKQLTLLQIESQYLASKALSRKTEKTLQMYRKQSHLLELYKNFRINDKSPREARRLAASQIKVSMPTVKRWFTLEKLEGAYQRLI
tara:strand:+ start:268 stop:906 length:639 start_codon:yes stop_codon:yes gene_type:complete